MYGGLVLVSCVATKAAPNCLTHSFRRDTQVVMADGSREAISEVEVGDEVLAADPVTGENAVRIVTTLWMHTDTELAEVTVVDADGDVSVIHTTQRHPFWNVSDEAWVDAGQLDSGDRLRSNSRQLMTVVSVRSFAGVQWMYDLTVDDLHTYYVAAGGEPVLVHNCNLARFDGPKPKYHVNDAHVPGLGLKPGKTPLPRDAKDVFKTAVPNDPQNPTAWFGRNADGQTYRFSLGNDGTAHFSGIDGVGDGTRNLTRYAIERLDALGN